MPPARIKPPQDEEGGAIVRVESPSKQSCDPFTYTQTLDVPGLEPSQITVVLDTSGQHTLSWNTSFGLAEADLKSTLPAGSCNLYLFPQVQRGGEMGEEAQIDPSPEQLCALRLLIIKMCSCELGWKPDQVGAFAMHAIVVANTDQSVDLAEAIFVAEPKLLTQLHVNHRAGFPLFAGESNLHICCVNRREPLLCKLIELANTHLKPDEASLSSFMRMPRVDEYSPLTPFSLSLLPAQHLAFPQISCTQRMQMTRVHMRTQVRTLLASQADGVFFNELPMQFYGGTALGYALCFDLRDAVILQGPPVLDCSLCHTP